MYRTMDPFLTALFILCITGIIAGLLAGMLGVGGGFLMVPVMYFLLSELGYSEYAMDIAVGTSAAVILPTAMSGTWRQWKKKNIFWRPALILGTGGIIGAFIGSNISILLPVRTHTFIFGLFLICVAAWMILQKSDIICRFHIPVSDLLFLSLGVFAGIMSGLFGIGGGLILTPVLATIIGYEMHKAVGIATTSMVLTAAGATGAYILQGWNIAGLLPLSLGYVSIPFWAALIVTSIPAAQVGVCLSHKTPDTILRYMFILLLIVIAGKMICG
jgi:uncharacterized protein